jgi:hypothetical protein
MSADDIKAKAEQLAMAKTNPAVKVWLDILKEVADKSAVGSFNASGEEAVRAWGMQKAFRICAELDTLYGAQVNSMASDKIIRPR